MPHTISSTYTGLVTLTGIADNPATITTLGLLSAGLYAVSIGAPWMIANAGSVLGTGMTLASVGTVTNAGSVTGNPTSSSGRGILLKAGGSVTNQSGGVVSGREGIAGKNAPLTVMNAGSIGGSFGVVIFAGGDITNQNGGIISGTTDGIYGTGGPMSVVNAGSISGAFGVVLYAGGSITNQSGGIISGTYYGVHGTGGTVGVVNAGDILGRRGVLLSTGGGVTNQSGGTISGPKDGIYGTGGIVDVVNAGRILSSSGDGLWLSDGGWVTNQSSGTIGGVGGINGKGSALTLVNEGSIEAAVGTGVVAGGIGVNLNAGGTIINQSGGSISGSDAISAGVATTVVNAGSITASADGVRLAGGGSVINQSAATINGNFDAVYGAGAPVIVVNAGSIEASLGVALDLEAGGSVTNQTGGTISGSYGIEGKNAAVTVVNAGSIEATGEFGVSLYGGGGVTNQSDSSISGTGFGVGGGGIVVVNAGIIDGTGTNSEGIGLDEASSVTNQSGGTISGSYGIRSGATGSFPGALTVLNIGTITGLTSYGIFVGLDGTNSSITNQNGGAISGSVAGISGHAVLTVVNAGTITAAGNNGFFGFGVVLDAGGSVINQSSGSINGLVLGVAGSGGAMTVVNAGSIVGGHYAVRFAAGYANRLVVDPTAIFSGSVEGGNPIGGTISTTLELASGTGMLTGLGTQFNNFGAVVFDTAADWFVAGDTSGLAGTISGFAPGDTIDLTGITVTGSSYAGGVLTLTETSGSATLNLPGNFNTADFSVTNVADGADVTLICFCAGTCIRTPRGEIEVEALAVGDVVTTLSGEVRPIVWIGTGRVMVTRGRRSAATPVIVRKGALADNVPHRDLRVTKAHSLFIDNVLIPVEFLVNHRSIMWDDRAQEVTVYHIELETHDVLIADGAPAESYRDDGNRWLFQNAHSGWDLLPQESCAPVVTGGALVDSVWRRLLDRAGPRESLPLTDDAGLYLLVDGLRVGAAKQVGEVYIFHLPAVPISLRVVSRSAVPAELGLARDPRSLGVAVRRITVRERTRFRTFEASDSRLSDGFHSFEPDNGFRWTDGDAAVPAVMFAGFTGPLELVLHVPTTSRYPDEGQVWRAA